VQVALPQPGQAVQRGRSLRHPRIYALYNLLQGQVLLYCLQVGSCREAGGKLSCHGSWHQTHSWASMRSITANITAACSTTISYDGGDRNELYLSVKRLLPLPALEGSLQLLSQPCQVRPDIKGWAWAVGVWACALRIFDLLKTRP